MIQSRGFESYRSHASGLFHTFPKKSNMTERLLNGRRAEIIHLCSFYNCGDDREMTTAFTAVPPFLQTLIYVFQASLTQMYILNFDTTK